MLLHFLDEWSRVQSSVVLPSQISNYFVECVVFLLHFLMMTPTLLSFSGANKHSHSFEDLVESPKVLLNEMLVVDFQEPVIPLIFNHQPVPLLEIGILGNNVLLLLHLRCLHLGESVFPLFELKNLH